MRLNLSPQVLRIKLNGQQSFLRAEQYVPMSDTDSSSDFHTTWLRTSWSSIWWAGWQVDIVTGQLSHWIISTNPLNHLKASCKECEKFTACIPRKPRWLLSLQYKQLQLSIAASCREVNGTASSLPIAGSTTILPGIEVNYRGNWSAIGASWWVFWASCFQCHGNVALMKFGI